MRLWTWQDGRSTAGLPGEPPMRPWPARWLFRCTLVRPPPRPVFVQRARTSFGRPRAQRAGPRWNSGGSCAWASKNRTCWCLSLPVTVVYATADGSALAPGDYTAAAGSLSFAPGETAKTVTVAVLGDTVAEPDESFLVNLSGAQNATLTDGQGVGTIRSDDVLPAISINDVTVTEGDGGSTSAVFTVSLSAPYPLAVSVAWATAGGTATAGSDYTARTGTLSFAAGVTTQTVTVPILGDLRDEPAETLYMNLSNPVNTVLADGQGVCTIVDNDPTPSLSISDVSRKEGNSGTTTMSFTVTLSAASGMTVTVSYATVDGSALAPSDYVAASGVLTFSPGTRTRSIAVRVYGDRVVEPNETLFVNLLNPGGATLAKSQGHGTIVNDD